MTTIPNSYSVTPSLLNQRGHLDLTHLIHHSFYTFLLIYQLHPHKTQNSPLYNPPPHKKPRIPKKTYYY